MADTPAKDPAAVWRDMMSQWEKGVNVLANQTMASDEFSGSMNQAMAFALRAQKNLAETMAGSLTTMNLPNRGDIERLGERLQSLEARMDQILSLLQASAGETRQTPSIEGPRRTKRPPVKASEPS